MPGNTVSSTISYKKYTTGLRMQVKSGHYDKETTVIINNMSRSTKHYMKNCDYSTLIGLGVDENISIQFEEIAAELARSKRLVKTLAAFLKARSKIIEIAKKLTDKMISEREKRRKIVDTIVAIKDNISLKKALDLFHISRTTFNNWKRQLQHLCLDSPLNKCLRTWPNQLTKDEVNKIKALLEDEQYKHLPLNGLYWHGRRDHGLIIALSTFYKYAAILGYKANRPRHRRKRHAEGLRAERPNQYWQADVTYFKPKDQTTAYIHLVIDNFSRRILNYKLSRKLSAKNTKAMLEEAYETFIKPDTPSPEIDLIVDGGSENRAEVDDFISQHDVAIRKMVAGKQISFSNSMVEAANKKIKYNYLYCKEIPDFETLEKILPAIIDGYNRTYNGALEGLTPIEVYNGKKYAPIANHKQNIAARKLRVKTNSRHSCPSCTDDVDRTTKEEVVS